MNIYKVDDSGKLVMVPMSGMNIRKAQGNGERLIIEFDIEMRVHFDPNPETKTIDVKIEFVAGKHWADIQNQFPDAMNDIEAASIAVRDTLMEDNPGFTVGELSAVIMTSEASAVPEFSNDEEDNSYDSVIEESMQQWNNWQNDATDEKIDEPGLTQTGPAGPSGRGPSTKKQETPKATESPKPKPKDVGQRDLETR